MTTQSPTAYTFPDPPTSERWKAKWDEDEDGHSLLITGRSRVSDVRVYAKTVEYIRAYGITPEEHAELQSLITFGQQALADYAFSLTREGRFQQMLRDTEYRGKALKENFGRILNVRIRPESRPPQPRSYQSLAGDQKWKTGFIVRHMAPERFLPPDSWESEVES